MIRARIYLEKYDWVINAYVAVRQYYTGEILEKMRELGASEEHLRDARRNMESGVLNNGLTFSNASIRETVWVTEMVSSAAEFFNTIVHEIRHVEQHVANEFGIDENSEEVCYLCGDIAKKLWPYCRGMLCGCGEDPLPTAPYRARSRYWNKLGGLGKESQGRL